MLIECEVCGKTFEPAEGRGRKPRYCSVKCRKEGLRLYRIGWRKEKRENDKEYYSRRMRDQNEVIKRRRANLKEQAILTIVDDVAQAETYEQIRQILEERCRVRNDYVKSLRNGAV